MVRFADLSVGTRFVPSHRIDVTGEERPNETRWAATKCYTTLAPCGGSYNAVTDTHFIVCVEDDTEVRVV